MSRVPIHDHTNISQGGKIRASTSITGADLTGSDLGGGGGTSSVDDHLMNPTDAHDASAVSILDAGGYTATTDVEAALQELYAQLPPVRLSLTNKSGGSVAAGDVVIIDTANDTAFTTTTSGQVEVSVGIAQATIASNATGPVLVSGYAALVNVPSSMTRGRYLETHTVAKQATGSATRRAGSFGQFLIGGSTPSAWLWGQTDQTATGGSGAVATDTIWDAKGDLAVGTGADTAAKLTVGSNDTILMADSGQTTGLKYVGSQTPSTQAFSDAAAEGTADTYARGDHKHGMPANPGGGGALVLLEQHTASSSATLDFTTFISSTYDDYLIDFIGIIPATNAAVPYLRFSTNGGSTYDTSNIYHWINLHGGFGTNTASQTSASSTSRIELFSDGVGNGIYNSGLPALNMQLHLYEPLSASNNKYVDGRGIAVYSSGGGGATYGFTMQGAYLSTTAVNAFRFLMSSGNITAGIIRAYGIAKT